MGKGRAKFTGSKETGQTKSLSVKIKFVLSPSLQEDIVGKTLLNILLDEEKEEIAQKIILNPPLARSGMYTWFCFVLI